MLLVAAKATSQGLAVGAWLGEVGVHWAQRQDPAAETTTRPVVRVQELMLAHNGLMDLRRILRNVGGNLNDVARHANSTGTLSPETRLVLALVARVVRRLDLAAAAVLKAVAVAEGPAPEGRP